jgi:hypothetical protein
MPQTRLGRTAEEWSPAAKEEFKNDAAKLAQVPLEALRSVIQKIAKTHPACNAVELSALEAERHGANPEDLNDAVSTWVYLWASIGGESPQAVIADFASLGLVSEATGKLLTELLVSSEPLREAAGAASMYLMIGAPLFADIRGTVDIRCRFHKTEDALGSAQFPSELVDAQQVIMANLTLRRQNNEEQVVSFLMDETDLSYLKRFVRNIEKELELTKGLLARSKGGVEKQ